MIIIIYFVSNKMFKLRDFVRANNIGWSSLSGNVNAMNVLKNNPEKINWALTVE